MSHRGLEARPASWALHSRKAAVLGTHVLPKRRPPREKRRGAIDPLPDGGAPALRVRPLPCQRLASSMGMLFSKRYVGMPEIKSLRLPVKREVGAEGEYRPCTLSPHGLGCSVWKAQETQSFTSKKQA